MKKITVKAEGEEKIMSNRQALRAYLKNNRMNTPEPPQPKWHIALAIVMAAFAVAGLIAVWI